jgi:hypothetical protein
MNSNRSFLSASPQFKSIRLPAKGAVQVLTFIFFVFALCILPGTAFGQQIFELPTLGPPLTFVTLQGLHFDPLTAVDVYFDSTQLASTTTDKNGSFGNGVISAAGPTWTRIQVPSTALPGQHTITAKEHGGQKSAQVAFLVRTDWPQFHFDVQHTGLNPYENVLGPGTVSGLAMAWNAEYGGFSPAVANGVVYAGSPDANLYALDAGTGALIWKYAEAYDASTPAVANGVLYFGSGWAGSTDTVAVYALNASTGAVLCAFHTWSKNDFPNSPAVANGVVYAAAWLTLFALDARTGAMLWEYATGSAFESSPAVANGVVFGVGDGNVYAVNASTGVQLWKYATDYDLKGRRWPME